jgi:hypothetical protein
MTYNFEFNQGKELRKRSAERQVCSNGICAVLSANWIRMMRDSKASGAAARKNELLKIVTGGGGVTQQAYKQAFEEGDDLKKNNAFLVRAANSSIEEIKQGGGPLPGAEIASYVAANRRAGVHFNFGYIQAVRLHNNTTREVHRGHAVAFWRSGQDTWHSSGHVYFFDPNYGEYKGNKREVAAWFTEFMKTNYGNNFTWWYEMLLAPMSTANAPFGGRKV